VNVVALAEDEIASDGAAPSIPAARKGRCLRMVSAWAETKSMTAWSEDPRCVVSRTALKSRLEAGWLAEEAISAPLRPRGSPRPKETSQWPQGVGDERALQVGAISTSTTTTQTYTAICIAGPEPVNYPWARVRYRTTRRDFGEVILDSVRVHPDVSGAELECWNEVEVNEVMFMAAVRVLDAAMFGFDVKERIRVDGPVLAEVLLDACEANDLASLGCLVEKWETQEAVRAGWTKAMGRDREKSRTST
jgi:hypothetical protein